MITHSILALTPEEARKIGVKHRSELRYLKEKASQGKLNFNTPVMRIILKYETFYYFLVFNFFPNDAKQQNFNFIEIYSFLWKKATNQETFYYFLVFNFS